MKGQVDIKIGDKVMAILGPVGKYAGTVFAIRHEGKHRIAIFKDEEGVVYETPVYNLTKDVPAKGRYPRKNPVKPRKGEKTKAFIARCMSEEKESFPAPKQRIAVCLSKSRARRNPLLESGADIPSKSDINRNARKMG